MRHLTVGWREFTGKQWPLMQLLMQSLMDLEIFCMDDIPGVVAESFLRKQ